MLEPPIKELPTCHWSLIHAHAASASERSAPRTALRNSRSPSAQLRISAAPPRALRPTRTPTRTLGQKILGAHRMLHGAGCALNRTRAWKRLPMRSREQAAHSSWTWTMESSNLSVNAVPYTVAAQLSTTHDPFTGPIEDIAPWNFTVLAVLMFVVTSLSLSENFLVMFVTFRYKQLRQPLNYIIVNLAIADFLVSLTGGVISFLTNARGYFFLGKWACVLEGFAVTFFGRCSASLCCHCIITASLTVDVSVGALYRCSPGTGDDAWTSFHVLGHPVVSQRKQIC